MGYLGYKPADKPLTSADITDGIIGISDLSATGTKDSTTFLRGDNSFATVSSDYVLLATTDITSSTASVSFDGYFSSTYKNYILYFTSLRPVTDNTGLYFRIRQSNADVTSSGYGFASYGVYRQDATGDGALTAGGNNTFAHIDYNNGFSNTSNYIGQGTITIFNPLTTEYRLFQSHMTMFRADETVADMTSTLIRWSGNTTALSGFTLYFSSGNIANGNFKLYGLK
jgi:hypothetical protein